MLDRVNLGGLWLKNPVTVASGTFGNGREYSAIWSEAASQAAVAPSSSTAPAAAATPPAATPPLSVLGARITKGVSAKPWPGNPGIRVTETASGLLNSIGLQNPGVEAFCASELPWLAAQDVPVIVNVCG
ncbi:MAG: hypothetical protein LBP28_02550, partial [Coriobacteriales bacterium]|nr:hypothetical protein [Coriobacteriales bacterium]